MIDFFLIPPQLIIAQYKILLQKDIQLVAKKKTLPKNFEELLENGDIDALKAVYETCDVNARWGDASFKQTAFAHNDCPDELARWLIAQGADIEISDDYGVTPLHARAECWNGRIDILLELGANVNAGEGERGTPLHSVSNTCNLEITRMLIANGARVNALDDDELTPLACALQCCNNADIEYIAPFAKLLLDAGADQTPDMKKFVASIGKDFEFYRSDFDPSSVDATSDAMDELYALFDVEPAPRRAVHDGKLPIVAKAETWVGRHQELWALLVPSSGAAETVQGEVIRISGKIDRELEGNGGGNWDAQYKKLADAFLKYVQSGISLPPAIATEAKSNVSAIKSRSGDTDRLCELAVEWVALNPKPIKLTRPKYTR